MESKSGSTNEREITETSIRGRNVRIVEGPERVDLIVDGVNWEFFETDDGVTLRRDAYRGPFDSLGEAVESYFDFYEDGEDRESSE